MLPRLLLVDPNQTLVEAWEATFCDNPEVEVVSGSLLDHRVDAWVCPTNSRAVMDGGLDALIATELGRTFVKRRQSMVNSQFGGLMPLGSAIAVPVTRKAPRYLISTTSVIKSVECVDDRWNTLLATAAALHVAKQLATSGQIESVAMPGIGTGTGGVNVSLGASLMWLAYKTCSQNTFESFGDLRGCLEREFGNLCGAVEAPKPKPKKTWLSWLTAWL